MRISIAIMAHPKRKKMAKELFEKLNKMDFCSCKLIMDNKNYEWNTGVRSLAAHSEVSDWHLVIQDDAIVADTFYTNVRNALEKVPQKSCVSFYFGTGCPFPEKTTKQFKFAMENKISWIRTITLFWGVCIAIPTDEIRKIITFGAGLDRPYDNRIGLYFYKDSRGVFNLVPAIVDHTQGDSILDHGKNKIRKAHYFEKGLVEPNNKILIF